MRDHRRSRNFLRTRSTFVVLALAAATTAGCSTYYGVAKDGDTIYLTGETHALFFGESWVRRCREVGYKGVPGGALACEDLYVYEYNAQGRAAAAVPASAPTALACRLSSDCPGSLICDLASHRCTTVR